MKHLKNKPLILLSIALIALLVVSIGISYARSNYLTTFNNMYGTTNTRLDDCVLCHVTDQERNPYGNLIGNFLSMGWGITNALELASFYDSDGDGYLNIDEIFALTFPGDAADFPIANCTDGDGDYYAIEGGECGPIDCNDLDFFINPGAIENCTDAVDNDCDDLTDCADPACASNPPCVTCTDADNDTYAVEGGACGPIDCNDLNWYIHPGAIENCTDVTDNDCDALTDCADPDCGSDPACVTCTDADGDTYAIDGGECGRIDCNDLDWYINPGAIENCTDSVDNDCNGKTDCSDKAACKKDPACS